MRTSYQKDPLLIYCPEPDWIALDASEIMGRLRQYVEIEWVDFAPDHAKPIPSMTRAHALSFQRAFDRNACLCFLAPDVVYSDGFVRSVGSWIAEGQKLVVCPALRADEEKFLAALARTKCSIADNIISVTARQLNSVTIRCLHSEILAANLAMPFFDAFPNNFHLRSPEDAWFVGRNLSWTPVLIDLSDKAASGADVVSKSIIDGHALAEIFSSNDKIVFVTDTSTLAQGTWGPANWNPKSTRPQWIQRVPGLKRFLNDLTIRSTVRRYIYGEHAAFYDWIKVRGLRASILLGEIEGHESEIRAADELLQRYIARSCGDIIFDRPTTSYQRLLSSLDWIVVLYAKYLYKKRILRSYALVLVDAVKGQESARERVFTRLKRMTSLRRQSRV